MVVTLQVDDKIADKFLWFLEHFSKDEIKMVEPGGDEAIDEAACLGLLESIKSGTRTTTPMKAAELTKALGL